MHLLFVGGQLLAREVSGIIGSRVCRDALSPALMRDGSNYFQGCKRLILATARIATQQASSRHTWETGE